MNRFVFVFLSFSVLIGCRKSMMDTGIYSHSEEYNNLPGVYEVRSFLVNGVERVAYYNMLYGEACRFYIDRKTTMGSSFFSNGPRYPTDFVIDISWSNKINVKGFIALIQSKEYNATAFVNYTPYLYSNDTLLAIWYAFELSHNFAEGQTTFPMNVDLKKDFLELKYTRVHDYKYDTIRGPGMVSNDFQILLKRI